MIPEMTERASKLRARVQEFMDEHILPNESLYHQQIDEDRIVGNVRQF